jgi:membrane protein
MLLLIAHSTVLRFVGVESETLRLLIHNIRWVIVLLLVFYTVSSIYRHGPALLAKWPFITPGSVFTTTLMFLATFLVSFWVNYFSNYNKLYGSISAVFILMVLIYVNSLVILLGFELNVTLANLTRAKSTEPAKAV